MTSCRFESNHSSTVTLHGGPVVLRPVRATPCFNRMAFGFHVYTICYFLRYDTVYLHALRSKNQVAQKKIVPITIVRKGTTKHSKPRPHQQQRRSNIVECYNLNDSFDTVAAATMSNEISSFRYDTTLSKGRNFVRYCCRNRQHYCQKNDNFVEATFDFVKKTKFYDKLDRHCCRFW